ncbi:MAG TPA: oxidoreductase-like domain-containing protein [Candidatus Competibacter sp.]|nr:oxidoreductase-like domain-containing protein [Candidatus Competibacter sp.]
MSSAGFSPPPIPPKPPVEGECCERGCERCMWVYYREALQRYETALAEWRRRHEPPI